ncbi:hypothetical protein DDB_G0292170 [Dictyostelium discoideum AX4]|uniref:Leucine-rich repeat-containing protein n=1 Tax=Dictyostelium discoideum TaxID=44689 RepID=Q54DS5_DICDI|nr:hypothetical protein DDB_G0292170 [Dictyostelium discoideum AX4]EAL61441.1 hypothetical protein DDB_G0292170 [Dictyostelium discoideum AX4]|eukprot:XP_629797.1 hypothetical protein DDB_G0292170 [Dictyostelium discoideum AX4]
MIAGRFDLVNKKLDSVTDKSLETAINEYDYSKDNNENKDLKFYHMLDIGGNMITSISLNSISKYFFHITELYLINNEFKEVPEEIHSLISNIDKLVNLEVIDFRANRITNLSGIENNLNLISISVSNNLVNNIDSIPKLLNLHSLFLFSSHIPNLESFLNILSTRCPNMKIKQALPKIKLLDYTKMCCNRDKK